MSNDQRCFLRIDPDGLVQGGYHEEGIGINDRDTIYEVEYRIIRKVAPR